MHIACLGWGSLCWSSGDLPLASNWMDDGPVLPVEYLRQSNDGRLTLVLSSTARPVRTLWAKLALPSIDHAREALRRREGIPEPGVSGIGSLPMPGGRHYAHVDNIRPWMARRGLDGVVRTALGPRFNDIRGEVPSLEEALEYLRQLPASQRKLAEEYVRRTPPSVMTLYREAFVRELGWTSLA